LVLVASVSESLYPPPEIHDLTRVDLLTEHRRFELAQDGIHLPANQAEVDALTDAQRAELEHDGFYIPAPGHWGEAGQR
jgi:hypothetical protein